MKSRSGAAVQTPGQPVNRASGSPAGGEGGRRGARGHPPTALGKLYRYERSAGDDFAVVRSTAVVVAAPEPSAMAPGATERIHSRSVSSATRPYTPGKPGSAQPLPWLVSPTRRSSVPAGTSSGPPESPWQVSTPPSGKPAPTWVRLSKPPNSGSTPSTRCG